MPSTDDYRELLVLDDAELSVLDGPDRKRIAPLPSRATYDDASWEAACAAARDRLVDRGYLVDGEPSDHVAKVLRARFSWRTVVLVEQRAGTHDSYAVAYLRDDGAALVEEVAVGGVHRFLAMKAGTALTALAALLVPDGVEPDPAAAQPARTMSVEEWSDGGAASVADARIVSTVIALRNHLGEADDERVDETRTSVFVMPDRVVVAAGVEGGLHVFDATRADVRARLQAGTHLDEEAA